jgi:PleD family two-component response regulator
MAHPDSDVSSCVTVSVGVCTSTPAIDSNWEELELVAGANKALTLAKQQGRNRIAAVEGQPEDPNV